MEGESKKVSFLKAVREALIGKKREVEQLDEITKFYVDSLKIANATNGMVYLIGPDFEVKEEAHGKISHQVIAQEIFNSLGIDVDFSKVEGDFGNVIASEYGFIFIRMASTLNGDTVVYYPEKVTGYQMGKLKEFNETIKSFNEHRAGDYKVQFEYNGRSGEVATDIDEIIADLERKAPKK